MMGLSLAFYWKGLDSYPSSMIVELWTFSAASFEFDRRPPAQEEFKTLVWAMRELSSERGRKRWSVQGQAAL